MVLLSQFQKSNKNFSYFFSIQNEENLTKSKPDESENRHKTEIHAQPDEKKATQTNRAPPLPSQTSETANPAGQSKPPPVTRAPSVPINLVSSAKNYEDKKPVGLAKQGNMWFISYKTFSIKNCTSVFLKYSARRCIGSRITESAIYHKLLVQLLPNSTQTTSAN